MKASVGVGILEQAVFVLVVHSHLLVFFFLRAHEIVGIDEVVAGVVRRVDIDHLDLAEIALLQELEDFQIIALDVEVLAVKATGSAIFANAIRHNGTQSCRDGRIGRQHRLFSFHTSAADSKNEQFVNVNVFNKVYYGTVTKNADAGEAIFTPAGKSADFLQIEGRWDDDAFSGDCVISYKDGESAEVQYKDGLISGKIKETDPDGIFLKYSAIAGKPYKKIKSYSADSKAASVDWFYLCTPISEWKANARSIPYKELTENPYDHVDHPIEVEGEVQEIYESTKYAYFKIKDDAGNPYLFRAVTLKTDKFATPCIPNLSVGDRIKIYGVYNGLSEISDSSTILYHRLLGYKKSFDSFKDWIISEDAMKQYSDLVSVTDVEALDSLPEFTTICGEIEDDDTTADPMHLTRDYREICKYPLYYADSKVSVTGKVVYENADAESNNLVMLLSEEGTGHIYSLSMKMKDYVSYLDKKITCSGTFNGNNKIPYCNPNSLSVGYALFPNITVDKIQD